MRFLFWFLLLAAAAVAAALAVKLNSGYVLLVTPPYRIELSLNLLLLIAVVGFVALYAAIRVAVRTARLPQTVRAWRRRQKLERPVRRRTPPSSHCSKGVTARHNSAPWKRWPYRVPADSTRLSARAPPSTFAISIRPRRCSAARTRKRRAWRSPG
jgi:hypothetical protein